MMFRVSMQTVDPEIGAEEDVAVETKAQRDEPVKVIIHNDNVTPIDFVISVLVEIFKRPIIIAEAIMWEAHNNGNAVVVTLPQSEAERLVRKAHFLARIQHFPLTFTIEPAT